MPKLIIPGQVPVQEYRKEYGFSSRRSDLWGMSGLEQFKPEAFDLKIAHEMRRDPTIATALYITKLVLAAHLGTYQHDDVKIQEFVSESLRAADGWGTAIHALLTAPRYGFALIECVWDVQGGRWVIERFRPRHPLSLKKGFRWDDEGNLSHVEQKRADGKRANIPIGKCLLWSFEDEFGESPEGQSILDACFVNYHATKALWRLWHRRLEQGPRPTVMWPVEHGDVMSPVDGTVKSTAEVAIEMYEQLESAGCIAYEATGEGMKPEVLSDEHVNPQDFLDAIRYHDSKKYARLLVPRLLVEEAEHATRAQSEVQLGGLFSLHINSLLSQLGEVLVDQGARRLIQVNFAGVKDYGTWACTKLEPEEREMWAAIIERLVRSGAPMTEDDWSKIRTKYDEIFVPAEQAKGQATTTAARLPAY